MKLVEDSRTGELAVAIPIHEALELKDAIRTVLEATGDPIDEGALRRFHDGLGPTLHDGVDQVQEAT